MSKAVIQAGNRKVPETDAGYANARLRGMRSNLLPATYYDRLLESQGITGVVKELMSTEYGPDLESEIVRGRTAAVVDDALKTNMVRSYQKVFSFLHPSARALLSTLLGRWDVFNIKTILRGAHNKVPIDEIKESFFPAGYMAEAELEALAKFDDVGAIIDTMAVWGLVYAAPLRQAYPQYSQDNDLAPLELALDQQYTEWAASRLARQGRQTPSSLARSSACRSTRPTWSWCSGCSRQTSGLRKAEKYFLEGGRAIGKDLFLQLAGLSDVDEVLDRLKRTPYSTRLDEAALKYLETNSISVFERALEDQVMRQALRAGVKDPHGVGVAIALPVRQAERGHQPPHRRQGQRRRHAGGPDEEGADPCISSSSSPIPTQPTASASRASTCRGDESPEEARRTLASLLDDDDERHHRRQRAADGGDRRASAEEDRLDLPADRGLPADQGEARDGRGPPRVPVAAHPARDRIRHHSEARMR